MRWVPPFAPTRSVTPGLGSSGWRAAAHLDPTLVPAHLALAEGYVKLGEPALAAQALRAGLVALPNSPELLARLEALIK